MLVGLREVIYRSLICGGIILSLVEDNVSTIGCLIRLEQDTRLPYTIHILDNYR